MSSFPGRFARDKRCSQTTALIWLGRQSGECGDASSPISESLNYLSHGSLSISFNGQELFSWEQYCQLYSCYMDIGTQHRPSPLNSRMVDPVRTLVYPCRPSGAVWHFLHVQSAVLVSPVIRTITYCKIDGPGVLLSGYLVLPFSYIFQLYYIQYIHHINIPKIWFFPSTSPPHHCNNAVVGWMRLGWSRNYETS
jgi:hypothetical protein